MKIRQGFISNSSSSSFVLLKKDLTDHQIYCIKNHIEYAKEHFRKDMDFFGDRDSWFIDEDEQKIRVSTHIDNFDMFNFLLLLGIEEEKIL